MHINDLETPVVLIDQEILDRNLRRMAEYCASHQIALRPHTKTHKIPEIARLQVKYGSTGITVAKVSEAEVMASAGLSDIVVVYPVWGESKWRRLAELARRIRIAVTMDSLSVAEGISRAAKRQVSKSEFDWNSILACGGAAFLLIPRRSRLPGKSWTFPTFAGKASPSIQGTSWETRQHASGYAFGKLPLRLPFELLDSAGIPYPVVSGGNTPTAFQSHLFHGVNEIRPGTYVFNDRNTVDAESASYADCAATVLTTVVSTSVPNRAMIDAGSKTLAADRLESGARQHFGYVLDHPEFTLDGLSEEHGHLSIPGNSSIRVGNRLRIIPNHICPCINLHDSVYLVSGDQVVERWKVAARGMVI